MVQLLVRDASPASPAANVPLAADLSTAARLRPSLARLVSLLRHQTPPAAPDAPLTIAEAVGAVAKVLLVAFCSEALVAAAGAPVPGAAVALLAVGALFLAQGGPDRAIARLFDRAIPFMPMLFVPVGVGIVTYGGLPWAALLATVAAVVVGTAATLVAGGLMASWILKHGARSGGGRRT